MAESQIKVSSIMFTDIVDYIKMGRLRPGQWNILCEDDDTRIHKNAEVDVGKVRL